MNGKPLLCKLGFHKWDDGWWDTDEYLVRNGVTYTSVWRQCTKCDCCEYLDTYKVKRKYRNAIGMVGIHCNVGWENFIIKPRF